MGITYVHRGESFFLSRRFSLILWVNNLTKRVSQVESLHFLDSRLSENTGEGTPFSQRFPDLIPILIKLRTFARIQYTPTLRLPVSFGVNEVFPGNNGA